MKKALFIFLLMFASVTIAQDKRIKELSKSGELGPLFDKIAKVFNSAPTRDLLARILIQYELDGEITYLSSYLKTVVFNDSEDVSFQISNRVHLDVSDQLVTENITFNRSSRFNIHFHILRMERKGERGFHTKSMSSRQCRETLEHILSSSGYFNGEDMNKLGSSILSHYFGYWDGTLEFNSELGKTERKYEISYLVPSFFNFKVISKGGSCSMNLLDRKIQYSDSEY